MGFTDSLKKVIGIEDIEEDEVVTEEELSAAKEKISRESRFTPAQTSGASQSSFSGDFAAAAERKPIVSKTSEKRYSMANTNSLKLVLIEPKGFEECPKLVDSLKSRKPVIINLEKLETETAKKIFDFLSGATYALNGNVQKITNNIFIFAPENVSIAASQDRQTMAEAPAAENSSPWR